MNAQKFEKICRESKMAPIRKEHTKSGNILLAEKFVSDPDNTFYEVLWAIERDELDVAGVVKVPAYRESLGMPRKVTIAERIAAAKIQAEQFVSDSLTVGRYDS